MEAPTIIADNKILTLDTSTKAAMEILQFAEDRRKIDIGEFLPRHIKTLAKLFGTDEDTISRNLTPAEVIKTFLEVLTFTAHAFTRIAKEYSSKPNDRPSKQKKAGGRKIPAFEERRASAEVYTQKNGISKRKLPQFNSGN